MQNKFNPVYREAFGFLKRSILKGERSYDGGSPSAISLNILPTIGASLNP